MTTNWSEPDWQREKPRRIWDPSRRLLKAVRSYQSARAGKLGLIHRVTAVIAHRIWSIITQAEIDLNARIGGGLLIPHPNGIVIHPDVEIGPNCLIFQQVTLGRVAGRKGVPQLGMHVDIGAGARILGGIKIGDHAVIGANAVVLRDVPEGATAVGIPARILDGKTKT